MKLLKFCFLVCNLGCAGSETVHCFPEASYLDIRLEVHSDWQDAGIDTPMCYHLEYLKPSEIDTRCGKPGADGCAKIYSQTVYIKTGLKYDRQVTVLTHEIGHLAKVEGGHLACSEAPGPDVMCPTGGYPGLTPTDRDVEFIKGEF